MSDAYARRGVSAGKSDVHFAIRKLDKGLYPNAFCTILPDMLGGDEKWCNIMHADGTGTKSSLAYLYWKETGDLDVWRDLAQDAIVMNTDDMLCAGAVGPFVFSNTIGRNAFRIPKEVLAAILEGMERFFDMLSDHGIEGRNAGGETADVGDLVRTIIYDATAYARLPRAEVITNEDIRPGSVIVGISSYGKAHYEDNYNSGIGSNGLTNGRHDLLHNSYAAQYPETYGPEVPKDLVYRGPHKVTDVHEGTGLPVGKLLLSPTRTYLPLMKPVLDQYRGKIHGLIHCTGGAQTKVMKFVNNLHVIKDNLFEVPPVFDMIQKASGVEWQEMYKVFNMGHRLEIYTDEATAPAMIEMAEGLGLQAQIVGRCEAADKNELTLQGHFGELKY
ncbi:MAG: AIR synthase related protein [Bacteroidia bacterium]